MSTLIDAGVRKTLLWAEANSGANTTPSPTATQRTETNLISKRGNSARLAFLPAAQDAESGPERDAPIERGRLQIIHDRSDQRSPQLLVLANLGLF